MPRLKVKNRRLRVALLLVGIAVALVPLVTVVVKDLQFLPVFSALIATTALLMLWGGGGEPRAAPAPSSPHPLAEAALRGGAPAPFPPHPLAAEAGVSGTSVSGTSEVRGPAPVAERSPLAKRPPSQHILTMLHVLAALDEEIIRLCELSLPPGQPVPASDARRGDIDDAARDK